MAFRLFCSVLLLCCVRAGWAQTPAGGDIPAHYKIPETDFDYVRREIMVPMRDGVKLFTVIVLPKGAHDLPMVLTRTPYNAGKRMARVASNRMKSVLGLGDDIFAGGDYIRVFQDVRGKYGSDGAYVMTRPVRGPLNGAQTDHVTDAYDTIDWLVKNVPESNGRVGMIGSSYEGFTVVMALLNPHPALKVAAPESPMVDGWMGDDWFHYGAFRQTNFDYFAGQTTKQGAGEGVVRGAFDDYESFRKAGSAGSYAAAHGLMQLPWAERLMAHPAYDSFWEGQALDRLVAEHPASIPTVWEQGLWDQEDMWGAIHCYLALKAKGQADHNYLVMGPWAHSQVNREGFKLGPFRWDGDTAYQYRHDIIKPLFDQYLKAGAPAAHLSPVTIYNTGENHWDHLPGWPLACESGCAAPLKPLYLADQFQLSFSPVTQAGSDGYVSDPAKPASYLPRPVSFREADRWQTWLVTDQRFAADRPDVLTYQTEPLREPLRVSGAPIAELFAATTGTDADWVVKLIDVYPEEYADQPELGGYQLPISMDILRGRYRESFARPSAIPAGKTERYRFALPTVNHIFEPGHRIMVQIQSAWFPLYDRNPQTYVDNIFFAKPGDYVKATQTVMHAPGSASAVWLPVAPTR